MKTQIVYLAPMQLRKDVMIGNIYSAVVADLYNKVIKILGYKSYFPLIVNVTGKKTENLLFSFGFNLSNKKEAESFIAELVASAKNKFALYGIDFDTLIRDDELPIENLINLNSSYGVNLISVKYCTKCQKNFGTDMTITSCNDCGTTLAIEKKHMLSLLVDNEKILKNIQEEFFFPRTKKHQLEEIILSFPGSCYFCLEKERFLTLHYKSRSLDPKFVAIQALVFAKRKSNFSDAEIVFFQGDVLKKFTYYSLAYLEKEFIPGKIICHGLITGADGSKLRIDQSSKDYFDSLSPKLIRAFLLSFQIGGNIKFSKEVFEPKAVGLIRILNKVKILLSYETFNEKSFLFLRQDFLSAITKFNYALAFKDFIFLIDSYWKITRITKTLHIKDKIWIREVAELYFGTI